MKKDHSYSVEHAHMSKAEQQIDHGNAAVLLDVGAAHMEAGDTGSLKLARDGHVCATLSTFKIHS